MSPQTHLSRIELQWGNQNRRDDKQNIHFTTQKIILAARKTNLFFQKKSLLISAIFNTTFSFISPGRWQIAGNSQSFSFYAPDFGEERAYWYGTVHLSETLSVVEKLNGMCCDFEISHVVSEELASWYLVATWLRHTKLTWLTFEPFTQLCGLCPFSDKHFE